MQFDNVCLDAIGYTLPTEEVSSAQLEDRLTPLYERLRLPEGRLELISGITQRRFFRRGTPPGRVSGHSAQRALAASGLSPDQIGAVVHGSVCRDHLEPATACGVHHQLGLSPECLLYDVSNACLGVLNGMLQVAGLIETGHIQAGIVVGTENGRGLVETTIDALNRDRELTRADLKSSLASLTIGSGSVAVVLCHRDQSPTGSRLLGATWRAETRHHDLCQSEHDQAAADMRPLMRTESEQLLHAGIDVGAETFERFLAETGWTRDAIDKTICHQVGLTHRKRMLESLGLPLELDYATVEHLGNTGSVALPLTLALASEAGHLDRGDRVALLGIGSGVNCLMLALEWQGTPVGGGDEIGKATGPALASLEAQAAR